MLAKLIVILNKSVCYTLARLIGICALRAVEAEMNILEPFKMDNYSTVMSGNSSSHVNDFYRLYFCIDA